MILQDEINRLKSYFLSKTGGVINGILTLKDVTAPATPSSGYGSLYVNGDTFQFKDDSGRVHFTPQTYSVTWASDGGTQPSIGDGTLVAHYVLLGKLCFVNISLQFGTTTSGGSGNWSLSLPFTSSSAQIVYTGNAHIRDAGIANHERFALIVGGASVIQYFDQLDANTNVNTITATTPMTWGNGDQLFVTIWYFI